jgi:hypothetical protein
MPTTLDCVLFRDLSGSAEMRRAIDTSYDPRLYPGRSVEVSAGAGAIESEPTHEGA